MDEREIRSKGEALTKVIAGREPSSNALTILKELQKGVKPTEDLLRKTQIGKVINKVKGIQGGDPEIPKLAAQIISQWRSQIGKPAPAANRGTSTPNGNASPLPQSQGQSQSQPKISTPTSTSPTSTTNPKLPTGVPLDKRTWKTDSINKGTLTNEPARNNSIGLLYDGLVTGSDLPPAKVLEKARAVESAIIRLPETNNTHSSDFYKEKVRSLYQNLKNKANPELRHRILNGALSPERFAVMTHDEMKSEKQKEEEAKIHKENLNNSMVPQEEQSISDTLQCSKCKGTKVSFTQAQTRSADEPMTTFCQCTNCGKRWKFS